MYNSFNNHGSIGLINTPSARFYDEGSFGITIYDGTPDQKVTLTSSPYSWLEASFFYTNVQGLPYPGYEYQDYKDKGFNVKFRLKEEGDLPAIAIGLNDFGKEVINICQENKVLIDVSHIGEKSFWDIEKISQKPFIASHSSVHKICPHFRNLHDDQIIAIKNKKGKKITVEVDTIKQLRSILGLKFNRVLLDNMSIKNLRESVKIAKKYYETEASGNVSLKSVKAIASTGVNRISVGSITHSAPAVDFKLEI